MECKSKDRPAKSPACHIEFAGSTLPNGSIRIERTGADSKNDWAVTISARPWEDARDGKGRSLAQIILEDVFSRTISRQWHDVFERDVVCKFGRRSFRITAAEVADWHLQACPSSIPVL